MASNTELRIARLTRIFLYLVCVSLYFMELSLAVCSKDMKRCNLDIHNSMQRKNIILCVDNLNYSLKALDLLDTECDGVDEYVQSGINDTYNCTLLNHTTHALFGGRTCKQLMVIECVRTVPMISSTTEMNRRDDVGDNSDGGEGGSDDRAVGARAFGGSTEDDDSDDDLILRLQLQRSGTNETPCNIFIDVSMNELGK